MDIQDLIEGIRCLTDSIDTALIEISHGGKRIISLSFYLSNKGEVKFFKTQEDFLKIENFMCNLHPREFVGDSFRLLYVAKLGKGISHYRKSAFSDAVNFIFKNTIHSYNLLGDFLDEITVKARELATRHSLDSKSTFDSQVSAIIMDLETLDPAFKGGDIFFRNVKNRKNRKRRFYAYRKYFNEEKFNKNDFRVLLVSCLKSGNSTKVNYEGANLLFIPLGLRDQGSLFSNAVYVIKSEATTDSVTLKKFSKITDVYQRQYKDTTKETILSELERSLRNFRNLTPIYFDWDYVWNYIGRNLELISKPLMFATNSHSFVFRKFRAFTRSLVPIVDVFLEGGKRYGDFKEPGIKIRDYGISSNAFTFLHCTFQEGAIDIPDIDRT